MAYQLTERAKELLNKNQVNPNLVLTILGYPFKLGAEIVDVAAYIGQPGLFIGNDWNIGGTFQTDDSKDYISLSGSSNSISQQLDPDKGGASSTQSIKIKLTDFNQEMTRLISPGFDLTDLLYRDANVYLGFVGGAFPEDYIDLFSGKIQQIFAKGTAIELTIAHPEDMKRSEIFPKMATKLVQPMDYFSAMIQDLTYYQRGDFVGTVQVRYLHSPFIGDVANVSVSGNLITVTIDNTATRAITIKSAIENDPIANQMVTVKITGTQTNIQAAQPITTLATSDEIFVEDVGGFFTPSPPLFRTFLRIEDEIVEYTGIDVALNKFTGVTRAALNSFGVPHDDETEVESFYKLGDNTVASNAIDQTLQLLMSAGPEFYVESLPATDFVQVGFDSFPNGILFRGINLQRLYNIRVGDSITIEGADELGNNIIEQEIEDIFLHDLGTVVLVNGVTFTYETESPALAKFKTQYGIFPDGVGMSPNQIDIDRFLDIKRKYSSSMAVYEHYLKDTIDVKKFINEQIYVPSALYTMPRKGRVSVGFHAPPLYESETKTLDPDTLRNPAELGITRSVTKNFYNAIVYKYNDDSVDERFLNGRVIFSQDSVNRINAATRPYTITANGLRPTATTVQLIERNARRYLERYKYAAESVPCQPDYKTAFGIEVGDPVIFGGNGIQLSDTKTGTRNFQERIFEVINKEFNWVKGQITLTLVDTNYSTGVRYFVFSPSSKIDSGSTTSKVVIMDSFGVDTKEKDKWTPYIGKLLRFHSPDYSFDHVRKLVSFDPSNEYIMNIDPPLPSPPLEGYLVNIPRYEDLGKPEQIFKLVYGFWTPTVPVVSGADEFTFDVDIADVTKFFVNGIVRVHNVDYSRDSGLAGIVISSIVGTTITVKTSLGFTPALNDFVDLIGFVTDNGDPYVWT